jgi:hypothetical protein
MTGHTGARDETVGPSGLLRTLLAVPLALVLFAGLVALFLKASTDGTAFRPDFPVLIDVLLLAVLVAVVFYGTFRITDLVRGLLR